MRDKALLLGMLAVIHLVACEGTDPVAPADQGGAIGLSAAPVIVTTVAIGEFPGSSSGISGQAVLTRTKNGLSVDQDVFEGLIPGNAYSVWWAIFDNPQGCDGPCDPSDLGVRQAQGTLVNGGGFVATSASQFYSSELDRHDVGGRQVWVGDPSGIDNPYRADVHVVLRNHGPAVSDPADRMTQTSTFLDFCIPVCANVSAAVFVPPHAPGQGS